MASQILGRILPLAVGKVDRGMEDSGATLPRPLEMSVDVGHTDHHRMAHLPAARRPEDRRIVRLGQTTLSDDHGSVIDRQLGPMIAGSPALDEAERVG